MTNNDVKEMIVLYATISFASKFVGKYFSSKRSAVMYGFSIGFNSVLSAAMQLNMISQYVDELEELLKKDPQQLLAEVNDETPFFKSKLFQSGFWFIVENFQQAVFESYILFYTSAYTMPAYNKKVLTKYADDTSKLGTYFFAGFLAGIVLALIYLHKVHGVTYKDLVKVVKKSLTLIPKSLKLLKPWERTVYYLLLAVTVLMIVKSLTLVKEIRQLKRISKTHLNFPKNVGLLILTVLRLKLSKKLKNSIIKQAIKESFSHKFHKNMSNNKKYDRIRAIYDEVIDAAKKSGIHMKFPKLVIKKDQEFSAYYHPLTHTIVVLDDGRFINKFTDKELAAIIAHELGHAYDLKSSQYAYYIMLISSLFMDIFIRINLPIIIRRYTSLSFVYLRLLTKLIDFDIEYTYTIYARRSEQSADAFAIRLGYGAYLSQALRKLTPEEYMYDLSSQADEHDIPARRIKAIEEAVKIIESSKLLRVV